VPVDLAELLEDAASQWLDTALAAEVDLGFEPRPAVVRGSAWMLHELLGNLIHNALRHSPPGSRVTVRSGCDTPGGPWLEVEDEGRAFHPPCGTRSSTASSRRPGRARGSGLGLAIVREVAERHQAQVRLLDGADGRGCGCGWSFPSPRDIPFQSLSGF
jgi:two-component system sensor histidine kinase TctE